jgi:hypothetical protein
VSDYLSSKAGTLRVTDQAYLTVGPLGKTIDGFEYSSSHLDQFYDGSTGSFDVQSDLVSQGTRALAMEKSNTHEGINSMPGEGLNYYPTIDDAFRWRMAVDSGTSECNLSFFREKRSGRYQYEVYLDNQNQEVSLRAGTGDDYGLETLNSASVQISGQSFYELEIESADVSGDVYLAVTVWRPDGTEVARFDHTDSTYHHSGSGIQWAARGPAYFDFCRTI